MPSRSPKMKRRIFGFQRRVWWPKWTPASRSSLISTRATLRLPFSILACRLAGRGTRGCNLGQARGRVRRTGSGLSRHRGYAKAQARRARSSACARSAGNGEWNASRSPVRVARARGASRGETGARGRTRRSPPYSRSPQSGWPIARKCARIWCVRPVSRRTRSRLDVGRASSSAKCVRASRGVAVAIDIRRRRRRSRPSGASIVPARAGGRPLTSARYSRTTRRNAIARLSRSMRLVAFRDHEEA